MNKISHAHYEFWFERIDLCDGIFKNAVAVPTRQILNYRKLEIGWIIAKIQVRPWVRTIGGVDFERVTVGSGMLRKCYNPIRKQDNECPKSMHFKQSSERRDRAIDSIPNSN